MLLLLLACTGTSAPAPSDATPPAPAEVPVQEPVPVQSPDAVAEPADDGAAASADPADDGQGEEDAAEAVTESEEEGAESEEEGAESEEEGAESEEEPAKDDTEAAAEEALPVDSIDADKAEPEVVAATTYTLSSSASTLYVQVFKDPDTVGAGISHDHVVVAKGWSGTVTWHPTDASLCQIDIRVPVSKLAVDSPSMRAAVGYEGELSENQRGSVKKNMLAPDQLSASAFPNITFTSTSCEGTTGDVAVTGTLAIRGQRKTITTTLQVSLERGFSATGAFKARHTDFGFEPYTAMMGALKNRDQMRFSITLRGQ